MYIFYLKHLFCVTKLLKIMQNVGVILRQMPKHSVYESNFLQCHIFVKYLMCCIMINVFLLF
jgi:hypothetical protein